MRSRNKFRSRARKACECFICGAPRRSHCVKASTGLAGRGVASRSQIATW